ncbi:hypothetical protein vseg_007818 [Gypsophila vaccaria]
MSRCFPFPPPGYERKIKADNSDLLKKEKRREKKHKREKKDKEKKESNEKHDKERTDEKRKEKKDKKEKHKDKKERSPDKDKHKGNGLFPDEKKAVGPSDVNLRKHPEKDKDREVVRNVAWVEKRVSGPSVFNNGVSVSKNKHQVSQTKIVKNSAGFGRRNIDEEKERRISNQLPHKNVSTERKKDGVYKIPGKDAIPVVDRKETPKAKPAVVNMDVLGVTGDAKFRGNAPGQNVVGQGNLLEKSAGLPVDGREKKDEQAIDGRMDGRAVSVEARSSGSALPPNSAGMVQNRVGATGRPVEKKVEQKSEEKEKLRRKEDDHQKGEKRKERDKEKPTFKNKEAKKEEKMKTGSEQKNVQMPIKRDGENHMLTPSTKNGIKMDLLGPLSNGIQSTIKPSIQSVDLSGPQSNGFQSTLKPSIQSGDSHLGKRKDIGSNGIYDELMPGPNKMARASSSILTVTEHGMSLEPSQNSAALAARPPMNIKVERTFAPDDTQRLSTNIKVDGKDHKVNGISTGPAAQSSQTFPKADRKLDVSAKAKLPHPDTKYLSQLLSVPKADHWPEFDDQEWLFSSNNSGTRKSRVETSGVDEEQKVWASALWLEPVDIFALPYVIPH